MYEVNLDASESRQGQSSLHSTFSPCVYNWSMVNACPGFVEHSLAKSEARRSVIIRRKKLEDMSEEIKVEMLVGCEDRENTYMIELCKKMQ